MSLMILLASIPKALLNGNVQPTFSVCMVSDVLAAAVVVVAATAGLEVVDMGVELVAAAGGFAVTEVDAGAEVEVGVVPAQDVVNNMAINIDTRQMLDDREANFSFFNVYSSYFIFST